MKPRIAISIAAAAISWALSSPAGAQVTIAVNDPQPALTDTARCLESGVVETWHVSVGDEVKPGTLLVSLDHARQMHAYEVAKLRARNVAPMESVMGELKKKEAALEDGQTRHRRRLITQEQLRMLEGDAEITRAKVKQTDLNKKLAMLDMELTEKLLEKRYVRSPIKGTVVAITHKPGETASAGTAIVTISDFSTLAAEVPLQGEALAALEAGDSMPLQTEAGGQRVARVVSIRSLPGGKTGSQLVKLLFANIRPGNPESYKLQLPKGIESAPPAAQADSKS